MEHILDLSARLVDAGSHVPIGEVNRLRHELSELADGIAIIESFSHVVVIDSGDGLVVVDTACSGFADAIVAQLDAWTAEPIAKIVLTHGHFDHVGGVERLLFEAVERGSRRPEVVAHQLATARFERYRMTRGYNARINRRQFGALRSGAFFGRRTDESGFWPEVWPNPDQLVQSDATFALGEVSFELHHARGETDDHLWCWIPERRALCVGDLFTWVFPNAGNPQKAQRYPLDWARALRVMADLGADLMLPAHGLPIAGRSRIASVLTTTAAALESLVDQVIGAMNAGATLDAIVHTVRLPDAYAEVPYLQPVYDEPEFVVRNIWRLYGGWYSGDPASLKPAPAERIARELVDLVGGVNPLIERALELSADGDHRVACQLVEFAASAEPLETDVALVHAARAQIYRARRSTETSMMAKGIFSDVAERSERLADGAAGGLVG